MHLLQKLFVCFPLLVSASLLYGTGNLSDEAYWTPQLSYAPAKMMWGPWNGRDFITVKNRTLHVKAGPKGEFKSAQMGYPGGVYRTYKAFELSFDYRTNGTASVSSNGMNKEKEIPAYSGKNLKPSPGFRQFSVLFDVHPEALDGVLAFGVKGKDAFLEVRNLKIRGIEAEKGDGRKLLLNGRECEAIYYLDDPDDPVTSRLDRDAAQMLRYAFAKTGGNLYPVKALPASLPSDRCAVFVGKAGLKSGLLDEKELKNIRDGGFAMRLKENRAAIAGARPSGVHFGVFRFLGKAGVVLLSQNRFKKAEGDAALKDFFTAQNPAVPNRELMYRVEQPELWGYTSHQDWVTMQMLGSHCTNCHAAITYIPLKEFQDSHPEYFALNASGKRVHSSMGKNVQTHYCMSNQELIRLAASRLAEMMKADPEAKYFYFFPGDGGDYYCKCAECRKLGSTTDRLLYWIDSIAKITGKQYPDRILVTLAYTDSQTPPEKIRNLSPNVIVLYAPYGHSWGSHLVYGHESNRVGHERMRKWEEMFPDQLGAFVYPNSCREHYNVWPAFRMNYKLYRHLAEKKYKIVAHCGFTPAYAAGAISENGSFQALQMKVLNEVLCDPGVNVEKLVDDYLNDAFGAAAAPMRKYFDLIQAEPEKRNWGQNTEQIKRGLVTSELAEKALPLLDEALSLVKTDSEEWKAVQREIFPFLWSYLTDNCRGNGKITKAQMPFYAKCLVRYVDVCRILKIRYEGHPISADWFWETAMLKIEKTRPWYDAPALKRLAENPLKVLGESTPVVQEKTEYGFLIANKGIIGGQKCRAWMRSDNNICKVLRRPSSTFGNASAVLQLNHLPESDLKLKVFGIDNEKQAPSLMEVKVNGISIFRGVSPFSKTKWEEAEFTIPCHNLVAGDNDILFLNITPDKEIDGEGGVQFMAKRDYTWGWFMIDYIKVLLPKQ